MVSGDAMAALSELYHGSPSIQAARSVLLGQLLSSGCVVRREGRDVPLKSTFARHLSDVWVPFSRAVIDSFLMFGFVVVSLEAEPEAPFHNFMRGRDSASVSEMNGAAAAVSKDPPDAAESRAKPPRNPHGGDPSSAKRGHGRVLASGTGKGKAQNFVPHVPDIGQYSLSFSYDGDASYRRQYRIFAVGGNMAHRQDFTSEVFFKSHPDEAGNCNSPVATCFQSASFVSALEELALQAEVVRARQMLVTQPAPRSSVSNNLDPANLFFDSESRAVQASHSAEDNAAQAGSLAMQAQLMRTINRLQTTKSSEGGIAPSAPSHVPPAMPPTLFAAPERQIIVPGVRPPEARSDLVDVIRVVNDHVAAALGVPASVIFEGKFSSNSMSQCAPPPARAIAPSPTHPSPVLRKAAAPQHDGDLDCHCGEQSADGGLPRLLRRLGGGRRADAAHGPAELDGRGGRAVPERPDRH